MLDLRFQNLKCLDTNCTGHVVAKGVSMTGSVASFVGLGCSVCNLNFTVVVPNRRDVDLVINVNEKK